MDGSTRPGPGRRFASGLLALLLACSAQVPLALGPAPLAAPVAAVAPPVTYVATTGDDASDGTTLATAVRTIRHAIAITPTDGTILVAAGTYEEHNLLVDKPLTILGDPGDAAPGPGPDAPVIDGGGLSGIGSDDAFRLAEGVHDVTISGFEIRNLYNAFDNDGTGVAIQAWVRSTANVTISDNAIHDVGYGVLAGNDPWDPGVGTHTGWSVVRNVLSGFVIGIELTQTSNSTAGDNILHMTDGSSGGTTHHAVTALWSYVWTSQHDLTFRGNTIDGALDPDYTATAFPSGGYPAVLVWARTVNVLTLSNLTIADNAFAVTGTAPRIALLETANGKIVSATISSNAFTAGAAAVSTDPPGRSPNSLPVAALVDATDDWWGDPAGPSAGQASGNVDVSHWIEAYTPGTRTPGFWPTDVRVASALVGSGGDLALELVDPDGDWHLDLDFSTLTGSGNLLVEPTAGTPATPSGFVPAPGAEYFGLATTGTLAFGAVRICIPYAETLTVVPHLFHYHAGWTDVTDSTAGEVAAHVVCGTIHDFSGVIVGLDATVPSLAIDSDTPDPSIVGQAIAVHVTLDAGAVDTDDETVGITDGTGAGCTVTLTDGTGACTFTPGAAGLTTLTATYAGSGALNLDPTTATAPHTVLPAGATVVYTGDAYAASAPATIALKALVGSPYAPCLDGRAIEFWWDRDGNGEVDLSGGTPDLLWGAGTTGPDGVAADATSGVAAGVYELVVRVAATEECEAARNTATLVVAGSGDKSNGGGWYTHSGRVSFGYTVQVKTNPKTGVVAVTGQLVWQVNGQYRIKGPVSTYTSGCTPLAPATGSCGYLAGTGILSTWSEGTGWIAVGPVGYRATVVDGGSATVCTKKRVGCTTTLKPDWFGMELPLVTLPNEGFEQLKGGNLLVK